MAVTVIKTGVTPNPAKSYQRRCAKKVMAAVPAMKFNREQLIGQAWFEINKLRGQVEELKGRIGELERMTNQEIDDMQK